MSAGTTNYDIIRVLSYGVALSALPATLHHHVAGQFVGLPIHLREIDDAALAQWSSHWHKFSFLRGGWDWPRIAAYYKTIYDDRFEVAVWCGPVLCGLAAGPLKYGRVEIDLMEGSPDGQHPLKGATRFAIVETARAYAVALGHTEVRLNRPATGLLTKYERMGFTLDPPHHPYCWMKVP